MEKKRYEAPLVEQLDCRFERGFAGSNAPEGTEQLTLSENNYGDAMFS